MNSDHKLAAIITALIVTFGLVLAGIIAPNCAKSNKNETEIKLKQLDICQQAEKCVLVESLP